VAEGRGIKDPRSPTRQGEQQPCHANVGACASGHLWLRFVLNDSLKECQPLCRQQVFLSGMSGFVGEKKTDEAFRDGRIEMVFQKVLSVFKSFEFHHFLDAKFFGSDNPNKLNDAFIARENLTIWI
jgi:hypothetical protein